MIAEYYLVAWCLYLGAVPLVLWLFWAGSAPLPSLLRQFLRVVVAVLLLTPMPVSQSAELWIAPASAILFVETVVQGFDVGKRALPFLFYSLLMLSSFLLLWTIFRNRFKKEEGPMSQVLRRRGSNYGYGNDKTRLRRARRRLQ